MASSSKTASPSSSARQWKYDVFLSFRGPDTRKSITSEIYDRPQNRRGIKTFLDDQDLEVGDAISPSLLTAIEESSGSAAIDMECPSLQHLYVEDCPHVPASAYDFGSNNQVILNDPLHYASQQATKFCTPLSAWDTLKSRLKVREKILTSMEPEMMQRAVEFTGKMSQIIQTKPEFLKKFLPSSLAKPELLEMMPRLMELLNGILIEKNPESMENLIALANITLDLMNHIPAEISEMMDLMTKLMEDTNFIKSLPGIVENIPGIMNLPRIIEDFPRLFEILPMTGSVENMPGIMEDFAQLIENSPQMVESLKDFAQSVENFLNLPQMIECIVYLRTLDPTVLRLNNNVKIKHGLVTR
ncbi:uncharacterized protein LOC112180301 [Rosa chinensis]|uniref:uncharacterized protein LOC112180301 n=1 Tax=Rosa chinensis TaxID=74649 RepID=UPI000D08FB19|nr:uncharacterized protein LOC112180301 [Rosa chinensis]